MAYRDFPFIYLLFIAVPDYKTYFLTLTTRSHAKGWTMARDGNGAGLGRVGPIPTPPHLFKIILIPVAFKKLNGTGRI